jgi:hypothetical protein
MIDSSRSSHPLYNAQVSVLFEQESMSSVKQHAPGSQIVKQSELLFSDIYDLLQISLISPKEVSGGCGNVELPPVSLRPPVVSVTLSLNSSTSSHPLYKAQLSVLFEQESMSSVKQHAPGSQVVKQSELLFLDTYDLLQIFVMSQETLGGGGNVDDMFPVSLPLTAREMVVLLSVTLPVSVPLMGEIPMVTLSASVS